MSIIKNRSNRQAKYYQQKYIGVIAGINYDLDKRPKEPTSYDVKIITEKQVIRKVPNVTDLKFKLRDRVSLDRINRTEWQITGKSYVNIDLRSAKGTSLYARCDAGHRLDQGHLVK
ncbi:hypothetical protein U472_00235 [Orenia metallireducens]|jgi:hypothetical protein|uniref:Uncharacterized protein n=1 Tax=Orenia metallireducens TaxID=1413210 RepID=A0A1C0ADB3_9FIRM|nr:hypothetical protein [Orenia metallireducens]OCL28620.1 hypothetical protein U472_00235 [Orenia metallireducens]